MLTTIGLLDCVDKIFGASVIVDIEIEGALGTEIVADGDLEVKEIKNLLILENQLENIVTPKLENIQLLRKGLFTMIKVAKLILFP